MYRYLVCLILLFFCTLFSPGYVRSPMTDVVREQKRDMLFFVDDPVYAARLMIDAMERNVGVFCFPWGTFIITRLFLWLPQILKEKLVRIYLPRRTCLNKL